MFARGSRIWLASPLAGALVAMFASIWLMSMVGFAVTLSLFTITVLLAYFFRDPDRNVGDGIVSPADGRVELADGKARKLSVVLGLRNVHVTRAPLNGEVVQIRHLDGRHRPAYEDVSKRNERVEMALSSDSGDIRLLLITGFLARRIKSYVKVGDNVRKGDRIGIIMFGSRVDLYLSEGCRILARPGQKVRAGESKIGEVIDDPR